MSTEDVYLFGGKSANQDGALTTVNEIHKLSIGERDTAAGFTDAPVNVRAKVSSVKPFVMLVPSQEEVEGSSVRGDSSCPPIRTRGLHPPQPRQCACKQSINQPTSNTFHFTIVSIHSYLSLEEGTKTKS